MQFKPRPTVKATRHLLEDSLPRHLENHTLALGELHRFTRHRDFLARNVAYLRDRHNVRTLGLEMPAFLNPFLWAYRDGALTQLLGSERKARQYLRTVFVAFANDENKQAAIAQANLAIEAMEYGLNVVAFDTRESLTHFRERYDFRPPLPEHQLAMTRARQAAPKFRNPHRQPRDHRWLNSEIAWLYNQLPAYKRRYEPIEKFIATGQPHINENELTSDALSATLFTTLAGEGNRVTLSGFAHLLAMHVRTPDGDTLRDSHGMLHHHLTALTPVSRVTRAVLASTAMTDDITRWFPAIRRGEGVAPTPIPLVDLDQDTRHAIPAPGKAKALDYAFPRPSTPLSWRSLFTPERDREQDIARHLNPLLFPDIARAANAIEPRNTERRR